jgi:ABC-type glucose/galactose transport system permease subunit
VKPGTETDELEPRLGFAEDVWIFEAGLEDVCAVNELGLVEGKVYGDVVLLVMIQPFVGKNDVVSHVLCTVIVITSVTLASFKLAKRLDH